QIIDLWLGQVPDYVVIFTRLIILISLVDAMAHPLMTSIHSTGHVALYQSVVGTLNILNLPVSYVFLKLGYSPVSVFYVSLVITTLSLFVRLAIVKRYIPTFPTIKYTFQVFGVCLLVGIVMSILPALIHIYVPSSLWCVLIVFVASVVSEIVTVFFMGLKRDERGFVVDTFKKKFLKK
ncbi:MAG: lipopolysaccharide biosynthesis protein, partial [Muribaculaceae bacterium]|nr:lipopolysaccharide biosynthesis protein [Muribaculaceae bacterium]